MRSARRLPLANTLCVHPSKVRVDSCAAGTFGNSDGKLACDTVVVEDGRRLEVEFEESSTTDYARDMELVWAWQ